MNAPRLFLAIVVGFVFIFASDFLIHSVWLGPTYKVTQALWRTESEMQRRFLIMLASQLLAAVALLYIWARTGWRRRSVFDGCVFGGWMGLFQQAFTLALYVVLPMPIGLAAKWFLAGIVQSVLLGALAALVYKPVTLANRAG